MNSRMLLHCALSYSAMCIVIAFDAKLSIINQTFNQNVLASANDNVLIIMNRSVYLNCGVLYMQKCSKCLDYYCF